MTKFKLNLAMAISAAVMLAAAGNASAFHSGGVANCAGCHTMHNSLQGATMTWNALPVGTTNAYLLKGADASSTCLTCHHSTTNFSGYRVSSPYTSGAGPSQRGPAGDFGWLTQSYSWLAGGGTTATSLGERHGHNIVASGFSYAADGTQLTAPGGTYDATKLGCISCHDPHGKYRVLSDGTIESGAPAQGKVYPYTKGSGSYNNSEAPSATAAVGVYRLLGGQGYAPKSYPTVPFTADSPAAIAPSTYNRTEAVTQTRVAYGSGMSEWCKNCHNVMHSDTTGTGLLRHPAGSGAELGTTIAANYNMYTKSGNLTGEDTNSYWSLAPFETGHGNDAAGRAAMQGLARIDNSQLGGPTETSNVMCLSCHRAHASGWDSMLRWNGRTDYLVYSGSYTGSATYAQGRTDAETTAAYYGRAATTFATYQRSLCNKCHIKD
jgi:hypothetical protein